MKAFNFDGRVFAFEVESVYDGDTCTLTFIQEGDTDPVFKNGARITCKCRLLNINAAELKPSTSAPERDRIIEKAREARDFLASLLGSGAGLMACCGPYDKYGRVLVTIKRDDGLVINDIMISNGHANVYHV